jgi:hypothetical protein
MHHDVSFYGGEDVSTYITSIKNVIHHTNIIKDISLQGIYPKECK